MMTDRFIRKHPHMTTSALVVVAVYVLGAVTAYVVEWYGIMAFALLFASSQFAVLFSTAIRQDMKGWQRVKEASVASKLFSLLGVIIFVVTLILDVKGLI